MYHIKTDKRSLKSAQLITDAFLLLTTHKNFQDITISDIERESGVARSTFYRLFDNTVDILDYKCDLVFKNLIELHVHHLPEDITSIMQYAGICWMKNEQLLEVITESGHQEVLLNSFQNNLEKILELFYDKLPDIQPVYQKYYLTLLSSMISGTLITWAKRGGKESPETLWQIICNLIQEMHSLFLS